MVSHIKVWERIVAEGLERTLILEDDFKGNGQMADLDEPTVDFDIAYLGRWKINKKAEEASVGGSWVTTNCKLLYTCIYSYFRRCKEIIKEL